MKAVRPGLGAALFCWAILAGCAAPAPQDPGAITNKEKQAVTEHFLTGLRNHDITLPSRAAEIPGDWLERVAKSWKELDAESHDLAVSTAAKMKGRHAGRFLLSVAGLGGEESTAAASALLSHPDSPDGNSILATAQTVSDPNTRFHLYRAAGAHGAAINTLEPIAAKESDVEAKQAATEALARLGHVPALHAMYERISKATAGEIVILCDGIVYVADKRLAKALISWLHKTDPVTRLGSDRSPAMARQCDFALWTAHQISAGVTLPVSYLDNYTPASLAAAKAVLQELPDLPPL